MKGRCFTCVMFYAYYPVTSGATLAAIPSWPDAGQRNLLPIVRIFHLSRRIQFTEQLIILQYLVVDSGPVARLRGEMVRRKQYFSSFIP